MSQRLNQYPFSSVRMVNKTIHANNLPGGPRVYYCPDPDQHPSEHVEIARVRYRGDDLQVEPRHTLQWVSAPTWGGITLRQLRPA